MKSSDVVFTIIGLGAVAVVGKLLKDALFPPDPAYVARKQELALEHAARMHVIVEVGVSLFFAFLVIAAIIGIVYLYHRARVVQIRPDEGGQYPILKVKGPDGRYVFINPNRLMAGAGVVDVGGLRELLPGDPGLLHMQHRVTTQDQAVQMARAAGEHGRRFARFPDILDGEGYEYYEDAPQVTLLQNVTSEEIDKAVGLMEEADGW